MSLAALGGLGPAPDCAGSSLAQAAGILSRLSAQLMEQRLGHRGPLHSAGAAAEELVAGALR